jgi:hypothetical protein
MKGQSKGGSMDDRSPSDDLFETLYSLRTDDAGRYVVVVFDRFGKRVSPHALQGLSFASPREAFDAIRRTEKGSGEVAKVGVNAAAAVRSA